MDRIFIEHKVKLADLQRAIAEFDLDNDEDVKSCKNLNLANREQIVKQKKDAMMEELKLKPDEIEELKEVSAEVGTVDGTPDMNGNL